MQTRKTFLFKKLLFQIAISLVLISIVLWRVEISELLGVFKILSLWHFISFILLLFCTQLISSLRWCLMVRASGINVSWKRGISSFFLGMYANLFGLGTVGGDVVRGTIVGQTEGKKTSAIVCAFADRFLGLIVLLSIGLVATMITPSKKIDFALFRMLSLLLLCGILGWIIAPSALLRFIPLNFKFRIKLEQIANVFVVAPIKLAVIFAITCFYHFLQISLVFFLAIKIQPAISFWNVLTAVPFINIMAILPISWNGIGVREESYRFFFSPELMSIEQAVALSLIWFSGITLVGIMSGIVGYFFGDYQIIKTINKNDC